MADFETTVAIFGGLELAVEWLTGGIVAAEQETDGSVLRTEPGMRAAIEEEECTELFPARTAATMTAQVTGGRALTDGPEPAAPSFGTTFELVIFGQGIGKMSNVIVGVSGGGQLHSALALSFWRLIGGRTTAVAMPQPLGALGPNFALEPLYLPHRQPECLRRLCIGPLPIERSLNHLQPFPLAHPSNLLSGHAVPPSAMKESACPSGVT